MLRYTKWTSAGIRLRLIHRSVWAGAASLAAIILLGNVSLAGSYLNNLEAARLDSLRSYETGTATAVLAQDGQYQTVTTPSRWIYPQGEKAYAGAKALSALGSALGFFGLVGAVLGMIGLWASICWYVTQGRT